MLSSELLDDEDEERVRSGRILRGEEEIIEAFFKKNDLVKSYERFLNLFNSARGLPKTRAPRILNVQSIYFKAGIWKLAPPTRQRAGPFFVMVQSGAAPLAANGAAYVYRKNIVHDFGKGAYSCGQRKAVPAGAQRVSPLPARNILRSGDAAQHIRYLRRLVEPRGSKNGSDLNKFSIESHFADDLIYQDARGGCDDPLYWTAKEKIEKAGARNQWRLIVALPANFEAKDIAVVAKNFAARVETFELSYVLAAHARPNWQGDVSGAAEPLAKRPATAPGLASFSTGHRPRNIHLHIAISDRNAVLDGASYIFAAHKNRALAERGMFAALRQICVEAINDALQQKQSALRLSVESYENRGIVRRTAKHLGAQASRLEQLGTTTFAGNHNRDMAYDERLRLLDRLRTRLIERSMRKLAGFAANETVADLLQAKVKRACRLAIHNWSYGETCKSMLRAAKAGNMLNQWPVQDGCDAMVKRFQSLQAGHVRELREINIDLEYAITLQRHYNREKQHAQKQHDEKMRQQAHDAAAAPVAVLANKNVASAPPVTPIQPAIQTNRSKEISASNQGRTDIIRYMLLQYYRLHQAQATYPAEGHFESARQSIKTELRKRRSEHGEQLAKDYPIILEALPPHVRDQLSGSTHVLPTSLQSVSGLLLTHLKTDKPNPIFTALDYLLDERPHWLKVKSLSKTLEQIEGLQQEQQSRWESEAKKTRTTFRQLRTNLMDIIKYVWSDDCTDGLNQHGANLGTSLAKLLARKANSEMHFEQLAEVIGKSGGASLIAADGALDLPDALPVTLARIARKLHADISAYGAALANRRHTLAAQFVNRLTKLPAIPEIEEPPPAKSFASDTDFFLFLADNYIFAAQPLPPRTLRDNLDWFDYDCQQKGGAFGTAGRALFDSLCLVDDMMRAVHEPDPVKDAAKILRQINEASLASQKDIIAALPPAWTACRSVIARGIAPDLPPFMPEPAALAAIAKWLACKAQNDDDQDILDRAISAIKRAVNALEKYERWEQAARYWHQKKDAIEKSHAAGLQKAAADKPTPATLVEAIDAAKALARSYSKLALSTPDASRYFEQSGKVVCLQALNLDTSKDWFRLNWTSTLTFERKELEAKYQEVQRMNQASRTADSSAKPYPGVAINRPATRGK